MLFAKWDRYKLQTAKMSELIRAYGLSQRGNMDAMHRTLSNAVKEIYESSIYDTEDLRNFGLPLTLFSLPLGARSQSEFSEVHLKDWWETNLVHPCQLDCTKDFLIRDMQAILSDDSGPLPVFDQTGVGNMWIKTFVAFQLNCRQVLATTLAQIAHPLCQMGGLPALLALRDEKSDHSALLQVFEMLNYQRAHPLNIKIERGMSFVVRVTCWTKVDRRITLRLIGNGTEQHFIY